MALVEANFEVPQSDLSGEKVTTNFSALSVQNVLFATDFSSTSEVALPYAAAICRRFGSTLHTVHVLSDTGLLMMTGGIDYVSMGTLYKDAHTEAKEKLDQIADRLQGVPHRSHVRHGHVWRGLADVIEANDVDLIVVGTHGRTGMGKFFLGSVAEMILRHAPCPVLTIGPKVSGLAKLPSFAKHGRDLAPPELELRQIIFATNFGTNAARLVQEAIAVAEEFRARLTLLHVIEDYSQLGRRPGPIEDGVRRLQDLIPRNAALQHHPEIALEFGSPSERILKTASDREADMIVLGARSCSEVGGTHLPWSAAHQVIAQARCPVLTIRE
jgi:nucleotide-binding universal stress UspA family protein